MTGRTHIALLTLAALALGGCRTQPTPTVVPTPVDALATLRTETPVVQFRERETEEPQIVGAGETLPVAPGGNVMVGINGHATLVWQGLVQGTLLSGTDVLVSLADVKLRQFLLDQAAGTARYAVLPGAQAALTVRADWVDVKMSRDEAEALVSFIPGSDPSVWVAMLKGEAEITRGEESLGITEGAAVGLSASGPLHEPLVVDAGAVSAWLQQLAKGKARGPVSSVALRCVVAADTADYLLAPDTEAGPAGDPLEQSTVLDVLQRAENGAWLKVRPMASPSVGWVATEGVTCNGPVASAVVAEEAPSEPTVTSVPPTSRPLATRVPLPSPVLGTPTATTTPKATGYVRFWTDDDSIAPGTCSKIFWEVEGVREVYVEGRGVVGKGSSDVCPSSTHKYSLRVIWPDGREETYTVEIEVREPKATDVPQATEPPPSPTPQAEPTTAEPEPTAEATQTPTE